MNRGKRGAEAWLRQLGRDVRRDRMLYLMILAPLAFLLVFSYAPMYGVQIAFRDYNIIKGIWDSPWVGLKHIRKFFSSYMFWRLMKNTLALSAYSLLKCYSFFCGANGMETIFSAGTPGKVFSSGLILPLNLAVGAVVACTMYGFYSLFKRGRI